MVYYYQISGRRFTENDKEQQTQIDVRKRIGKNPRLERLVNKLVETELKKGKHDYVEILIETY